MLGTTLSTRWVRSRPASPLGLRESFAAARRDRRLPVTGAGRAGGAVVARLAVAGSDVDVFVVADELRARGFYAQVQPGLGPVPRTLHFSAHGVSPSTVDALVAALAESVVAARAAGPVVVPPAALAAVAAADLSTLDEDGFATLLAASGLTLTDAAGRPFYAVVNALLETLAPADREAVLRLFLSVLFTP
jgi:hypothetical protein